MLSFEKSSYADFDAVYDDMLQQFPKEELKSKQILSSRIKNGVYQFLRAFDDKKSVGYALLFSSRGHLFIDYIAVYKPYHSNGYGGQMLEALKNSIPMKTDVFWKSKKSTRKKKILPDASAFIKNTAQRC